MGVFDLAAAWGHEEVLLLQDPAAGLRAVVAIHDTTLGPAVGGTRMRPFASLDDAVAEALRLSRAATHEAALAGTGLGGARAVLVGEPGRDKTRALLTAYARALDRLGGRIRTGPDLGFDARDVAVLARQTRHASQAAAGGARDVADFASLGALEAVLAAASFLGLAAAGLRVAIHDLGPVGRGLAALLAGEGARLTVAGGDADRAGRVAAELGARAVEPEALWSVEADVVAATVTGSLDGRAAAALRCRAVVGAGCASLADAEAGDALFDAGVLYAPDAIAASGGLAGFLREIGETDEAGALRRVREVGPRLLSLWGSSQAEGIAPHRLAERQVEERLASAREAKRRALADRG
jgi:leucine dehydrogenase